ncbi:SIR2 family protein [Zafaria sp. Z1313]|uniref:SIR2 family protein n=1 Tax=Zafaria sp. Z1313 TaxID=3423202 RepID=UPI003D302AA3
MSAPDIDQAVMAQFAPLAGDADLTLVLGAGASAPSGLPTWDQFARSLATISGVVAKESAADILLSKQDPTIVLEAARASSGKDWELHLNKALFGGPVTDPRPSPLHLAAAGQFLAAPRSTLLSTLNYDTLLEEALLDNGNAEVLIGIGGSTTSSAPIVHHLHGALWQGAAYDPVVSFRDYAELVENSDAWQRQYLSQALSRGPLLLAGTSYRDPAIRHWLHLILRDESPKYPALVTIVREGLGLDRASFALVDRALASEWESIGLSALRMHDLSDVAHVIRELRFIGQEGYRTPQERARQVWSSHARRFDRLQDEYSALLAEHTDLVADTLGTKAHRGTLWLANGRSRLARWATVGSRYRGIRDLKLVPTGHDSPWVAGEAIGSEEVKLKDIHRDHRVTPSWRSVLAIPIFVGDGQTSDFATAVLTFGLSTPAARLVERSADWESLAEDLNNTWGARIGDVSFPVRVN